MTGLAFGPPRSQQHLQEGRAASAPSSSTPTAHVWTHQSRRPANGSTVVTSASAYSTDVDTWASWDTSLLYSKSVNIFSDPYTAVGSDSTAI